jgi:hypothetical protein
MRQFELARVLGWAFFDQYRVRAEKQREEKQLGRKKIRTQGARKMGEFALMALLKKNAGTGPSHAEIYELIRGTEVDFLRGAGPDELAGRLDSELFDASCVTRIVKFLGRASVTRGLDGKSKSVEDAKAFVVGTSKVHLEIRNASDIWEVHRSAAPLHYGFREIRSPLRKCENMNGVIEVIFAFAEDAAKVRRALEVAAWIADFLDSRGVRRMRLKDFKAVDRRAPKFLPFSPTEIADIAGDTQIRKEKGIA